MTPTASRLLLAAVSFIALASCDDAPESPLAQQRTVQDEAPVDPESGPAEVTISRSRFEPRELIVPAGTTVTFVNHDAFAHTVTSRDDATAPFESGELTGGTTFEVTFDEPGEYAYFCRIHPTMRATVMVE